MEMYVIKHYNKSIWLVKPKWETFMYEGTPAIYPDLGEAEKMLKHFVKQWHKDFKIIKVQK